MINRRRRIFFVLYILFLSSPVFANIADAIIAYPVPFNPRIQSLTIDYSSGAPASYTALLEIFDFNGDLVLKRSYNSLPIRWRGYNSKGKAVKAGLYICKIRIEDQATGKNGTKIIRILVKK